MKIDKKAINYYYSFFEVSKELNQKQFYEFNMAIYKVMFFEEHINNITFKDSMLTILWKSVKHSIRASVQGYCDKKSIPYDECFTPLNNPLSNNDKRTSTIEQEKEQVQVVSGFTKPTIQDIKIRCSEMKYNIDYEHFYNYYESNGWRVGRNKMKSWQSALANWNKNNTQKPNQQNLSFKQQDNQKVDSVVDNVLNSGFNPFNPEHYQEEFTDVQLTQ